MAAAKAFRKKATISLDRSKATRAKSLIGARSISQAIDVALDRLIRNEQLRRDVAAYKNRPLTDEELAFGDLPVALDLGDEDVDYDKIYGKRR